eukprot:CAMPEP_0204497862 /NCGR_PEP_ID=MMETSP0471-20130131/91749_1 /ASSEMBLY_ACC=CAM_ASM_000602 /TAXON_ID=2969 /ORGANISM="Oxyrrhis marina" /LENGTH=118 /DNA_ID=CAMNT_0051502285 /DNA_START=270 /DNA_END=622 /DNA_ORIENTATION=+
MRATTGAPWLGADQGGRSRTSGAAAPRPSRHRPPSPQASPSLGRMPPEECVEKARRDHSTAYQHWSSRRPRQAPVPRPPEKQPGWRTAGGPPRKLQPCPAPRRRAALGSESGRRSPPS